jgi:hypothetical protein
LGTDLSTTLGYDPSNNGAAERYNKTLLELIRKHEASPKEWDSILPFCTFSYNINEVRGTKFAPFELFFGRKIRFPLNPKGIEKTFYHIDEDTYLQNFREQWHELLKTANTNLVEYRENMKSAHDKSNKTVENKFEIDEWVMMKLSLDQRDTKLSPLIFGPYRIVELLKASAKISPTEKNRKVMDVTVPLERLIKIPDALKNIKIEGKYPGRKIGTNLNLNTFVKYFNTLSVFNSTRRRKNSFEIGLTDPFKEPDSGAFSFRLNADATVSSSNMGTKVKRQSLFSNELTELKLFSDAGTWEARTRFRQKRIRGRRPIRELDLMMKMETMRTNKSWKRRMKSKNSIRRTELKIPKSKNSLTIHKLSLDFRTIPKFCDLAVMTFPLSLLLI